MKQILVPGTQMLLSTNITSMSYLTKQDINPQQNKSKITVVISISLISFFTFVGVEVSDISNKNFVLLNFV